MPSFTPQRYEQIMSEMVARTVLRSRLYDVADTSGVKHILAACARVLEKAYDQAALIKRAFSIDSATGSDLDARARDIQPGTIARINAQYANGYIVASRNVALGNATVPNGTVVTDANGNTFVTTQASSFNAGTPPQVPGHSAGQDSTPIPVVAMVAGAAGNVASGGISAFSSRPPGIDSVTNLSAFVGGSDQETDDSFRARIKLFLAGLSCGTVQSLESAVYGKQDSRGNKILYARAYEDIARPGYVTLYIDDGTGTAAQVQQIATTAPENVCQSLTGPRSAAAAGGETTYTLAHGNVVAGSVAVISSYRGQLSQSAAGYTIILSTGKLTFPGGLAAGEVLAVSYRYTASGSQVTVAREILALGGPSQGAAVGGEVALKLAHAPVVQQASFTLTSSYRGRLNIGTDFLLLAPAGTLKMTPAVKAGEVITAAYSYDAGLVALAQKIVDGDESDPQNYPGYRSAGVRVDVQVPQILEQTMTVFADIDAAYERSAVNQGIVEAISTYINSLGIGDDVLFAEVVAAAMSVSGVRNFAISAGVTRDVTVLDNQLARASTITFSS